MADYNLKIEMTPTDKYEKAKKEMITACKSFHELEPKQKEQLVLELAGMDALIALYSIMTRTNNRGGSL